MDMLKKSYGGEDADGALPDLAGRKLIARCNLECDYCFFLKKDRLYPDSNFRMSDEMMETYIRQNSFNLFFQFNLKG